MIILHQSAPAWGLPSLSPHCLYAESYLRLAGIAYRADVARAGRSPTGKLPYATLGDGRIVAGADAIIDALGGGDAASEVWIRLVEERIYPALGYLRWARDVSFAHVAAAMPLRVPWPVRGIVARKIRGAVLAGWRAQGVGRRSQETIVAELLAALAELTEAFAERPHLSGEAPGRADACAFAFLAHLLWVPWEGPETEAARGQKALEGYADGLKQRWWSDIKTRTRTRTSTSTSTSTSSSTCSSPPFRR